MELAEDVAKSLGFISLESSRAKGHMPSHKSQSSSNSLLLDIVSAKGLPMEPSETLQNISVHVSYRGQMHSSSGVISNNESDVVFDWSVTLTLGDEPFSDVDSMKSVGEYSNSPLLIYVTTMSVSGQGQQPVGLSYSRTILAAAVVDIRMAFIHRGEFISIELLPCADLGGYLQNGGGSMFVKLTPAPHTLPNILSFSPRPSSSQSSVSAAPSSSASTAPDMIEKEIEYDIVRLTGISRTVSQAARSFWARARKDYPQLEGRDIKLFAEDEVGQHRLVCSFVAPLIPPRDIESPKFAARFVSLIPFKRETSLTGGRMSIWHSSLAILSSLQGDVEDHALLLCNLLLGFGMDAWVAMGSIASSSTAPSSSSSTSSKQLHKRPHVWVLTLDTIGDGKVLFWESLTGQVYEIEIDKKKKGRFIVLDDSATQDGRHKHPFIEIHALFRHDVYLLNVQKLPLLSHNIEDGINPGSHGASFNLRDTTHWLPFPVHDHAFLRHPGCDLRLQCTSIDQNKIWQLEADMESSVKVALTSWRTESGLQTHFSERLSIVLQSALLSYEMDRSLGISVGNADFQAAVKRNVRAGESFKAYPTCFSHCIVPIILASLRQAPSSREIVLARSGPSSKLNTDRPATIHAVRVKIKAYSQGTLACWIMIAACFGGF